MNSCSMLDSNFFSQELFLFFGMIIIIFFFLGGGGGWVGVMTSLHDWGLVIFGGAI